MLGFLGKFRALKIVRLSVSNYRADQSDCTVRRLRDLWSCRTLWNWQVHQPYPSASQAPSRSYTVKSSPLTTSQGNKQWSALCPGPLSSPASCLGQVTQPPLELTRRLQRIETLWNVLRLWCLESSSRTWNPSLCLLFVLRPLGPARQPWDVQVQTGCQPLPLLSCRQFPWAGSNPGNPGLSPSNCARPGGHLIFAETDAPVTGTNQLASLMLM